MENEADHSILGHRRWQGVGAVAGIISAVVAIIALDRPEPSQPPLVPKSTEIVPPPHPHRPSEKLPPEPGIRSDPALQMPVYKQYVNEHVLLGGSPINAVAIKGNVDAARDVIGAMGAKLQQGVFSTAFVREGIFDRALQGDSDAIARLQLPPQIQKIILVQVSEPQRRTMRDFQNATKISETVHIVIVEARTGAVIGSSRFVAEGMGFGEQYVQEALMEDLSRKLADVKRSL
jgi:hypothetical protein